MKAPTLSILIFILLGILSSQGRAQSLITGRVLDDDTKEPLGNVLISVVGKVMGTTSNHKGFFQIEASENDSLTLKLEGYRTNTVLVTAGKGVQVLLRKKLNLPYEGGEEAFYKFLGMNIRYPKEARDIQRQGVVYVTFTADTTKALSKIKVFSDIGRGCGSEVVRVLNKLPKEWTCTEPTTFILPVTFRLDGLDGVKFTHLKKEELPVGKLMPEMIVTNYEIRR